MAHFFDETKYQLIKEEEQERKSSLSILKVLLREESDVIK